MMKKNEDLLKDTPETGEEDYTENVHREPCGCACSQKGILIRKPERGDRP